MRGLYVTFRNACAEAAAKPAALASQMAVMIVNDVVWVRVLGAVLRPRRHLRRLGHRRIILVCRRS